MFVWPTVGLAEDCAFVKPELKVEGQSFYTDEAGSIIDDSRLKQYLARIRNLRFFVTELSRGVDNQRGQCAIGLLSEWAEANAMLQRPDNFQGIRERQRFAISLNLVVLKLRHEHTIPSGVLNWLTCLNQQVLKDFDRRHTVDNLFVWSGVGAASFQLIQPSAQFDAYAANVWRLSTAQIQNDGTIPSEQRRASRSVLYHNYYLTALVLLRELRQANGDRPTPEQAEAVNRLTNYLQKALCNLRKDQIAPPPWEMRVIAAFGTSTEQNVLRCTTQPPNDNDPMYGGHLHRLKEILKLN